MPKNILWRATEEGSKYNTDDRPPTTENTKQFQTVVGGQIGQKPYQIQEGAVPLNSQGYNWLFLPRIYTNFTNYFSFFGLICANSWRTIAWEARISAPNSRNGYKIHFDRKKVSSRSSNLQGFCNVIGV
jgi:hypothetical protein